jgi:hypothetical protein
LVAVKIERVAIILALLTAVVGASIAAPIEQSGGPSATSDDWLPNMSSFGHAPERSMRSLP